MPSNKEKLRRKELIKIVKVNESELPISFKDLAGLLNYIDEEISIKTCDDTLAVTKKYLKELNLSIDKIIPWLNEYGGYCDCEVLANVEDAWYNEIEDYL